MESRHNYHYKEVLLMMEIFKGLDDKYRYIREHTCFSSIGYDYLLDKYQRETKRIHLTLNCLDPLEAYIITQSFVNDGTIYNGWWKGMFSKSSFYRMRYKAVLHFLKEYQRVCSEIA